MTTIQLITYIQAPMGVVFDTARNIDTHMDSAAKTKEKAVAGTTSGLISLNETVTWKGKHFGLNLTHQSKITALTYPTYFVDEMIQGHFKSFKHQHIFEETPEGTKMMDILEYETPYGMLGWLFDMIALKKHLTHFLYTRNEYIKNITESKNLD